MTARLRPGRTRERALEVAGAMPTHPSTSGFDRLSVFPSEFEACFLIDHDTLELMLADRRVWLAVL
ncbi:MAG: hypothetical protein AUH17_05280 [Actinobacteria bacterium 13_2_20CM_68_14]|nr:MAG: hypothetical protein AUH17_05280 [Actinobacteria bacterium 13_2_20CM_68_14]